MRVIRWMYGAGALFALAAGGLTEPACSGSSPGTPVIAMSSGSTSSSSSGSGSSGADSGMPYNPNFTFTPGNGMPCTSASGDFAVSTCDPSDETGMDCTSGTTNGCSYDSKCGDLFTCEPFTDNPVPGTGVDNFRMRDINITTPAALVAVQGLVVAAAVNLPSSPDGGAKCGELQQGTGLFNWLISVNQKAKTVETGGSPPSTDPFNVGYCYINGKVSDAGIAPVTIGATFTGDTFTTDVLGTILNIPIFLAPSGVVILPINGASFHDVHVSSDGNCIGAINISANNPSTGAGCESPLPAQQTGVGSCSRWHAAGALGGYITLKQADTVLVQPLFESLCVLLAGSAYSDHGSPEQKCTTAAYTEAGDYCSTTNSATGCKDSVWLSAQFAASAVKIATGTGVDEYMNTDLCNGGSL